MSEDISSAISGVGDFLQNNVVDPVTNFFSGGTTPDASAAAGAADAAGAAAGTGFDLSSLGGGIQPSDSTGVAFPGSTPPANITVAPLAPAASSSGGLGSTIGGAASAAAAGAPPGDVSLSGSLGDTKDLSQLGSQIGGGGVPFGSDTVPTQALEGKPDIPTAGGAPAAAPHNSILNAIQNPSLDSAMTAVGNNLSPLLGAVGLGLTASRPQNLPQQNELVGQAQGLNTAAAPLVSALTTGQMPAGAQTALDQARQAEKAHIRSQYASMGLSGSTMETQALNQVDQAIEAQKFTQLNDLVKTGLNETQLSSQIYQELQRAQLAGDKELAQALAEFAASIGGAGTPARAVA